MSVARQALLAGSVALLVAAMSHPVGAQVPEDLTAEVNRRFHGCSTPTPSLHPPSGSALVSYFQDPDEMYPDETQHIFFIDSTAHIHELYFGTHHITGATMVIGRNTT